MTPELPARADVAIVGAGAAGLAIALELARRGVKPVVLERGRAGERGASALGAAAGLLAAQAQPGPEPEPVRDLALLARHLYADWVRSIEEETGIPCELALAGGFTVARTEAEEVELDRLLDWQRARGLAFEILSADEAREREPALGPEVRAAFWFPRDGTVVAERLGRGLLLASRRSGALVLEGTPVLSVRNERGRGLGVETPYGFLPAGAVVNAAGAWAGALPCGTEVAVEPMRGQAVLLDASGDPDRLGAFVSTAGASAIPRKDGLLLASSTPEKSGFDPRPTAAGVAALLTRIARIFPAAGSYAILGEWAGLGAGSPDGIPFLGETPVRGLFLAAGLGRNGILLAPAVGVLIADLLTDQSPPLPLGPFSCSRFDS